MKHDRLQGPIVLPAIHAEEAPEMGNESLGPGRFHNWLHLELETLGRQRL